MEKPSDEAMDRAFQNARKLTEPFIRGTFIVASIGGALIEGVGELAKLVEKTRAEVDEARRARIAKGRR